MTGGGSAALRRGRWVLANDSSFDRDKWYLVGLLTFLAVAVIVASVVKWRRGKHRADPALKAVNERIGKVEEIAAASSLQGRLGASEDDIADLKAEFEKYRNALLDTYAAAGLTAPADLQKECPEPLLRIINGGKGA